MKVDASDFCYLKLYEQIKASEKNQIIIVNCLGQRCIGNRIVRTMYGMKKIPQNGLGAYLNGGAPFVRSNECPDDAKSGGKAFHNTNRLQTGPLKRAAEIQTDIRYLVGKFMDTFSDCFGAEGFYGKYFFAMILNMKHLYKQLYFFYSCKEVISCEG